MKTHKLNKFINRYKEVFPLESQPSIEEIKLLRKISTKYIESMNNLIYIKESNTRYEILAHWCIANSNRSKKDNMKAFFEVLRYARNQCKPVVISNLNNNYYKSTKQYDDKLRMF